MLTYISSQVLKLGNMVTPLELVDAQECADIAEDVRSECSPAGQVTRVLIPRAADGYPASSEVTLLTE